MQFIQLPLLGTLFSQAGKSAKNVNGRASAKAKPNMPTVGPSSAPLVLTSTRRKPMIGPVHEKLTRLNVNAIRKMLNSPLDVSDLWSTALVHLLGREISKPPKKLVPKNTSRRKKNTLNTALVLSSFSLLAPKNIVTSKPNSTYMITILAP